MLESDLLAFIAQEQSILTSLPDVSALLVNVGPVLERLRNVRTLREHFDDALAEAEQCRAKFVERDTSAIARLREVRAVTTHDDRPQARPPFRASLDEFDSLIGAKFDAPLLDEDAYEPTTSRAGILIGQMNRHLAGLNSHLEPVLTELASENAIACREYAHARRVTSGFALARLTLLARQVNPQTHSLGQEGYLDDHHRSVYAAPEIVRHIADGYLGKLNAEGLTAIRTAITSDIARLFDDLRRRIGSVRSRERLLETYKLRCEWYDRDAMRTFVESLGRSKEDPLTDHLARFLFDAGMRPWTRAAQGGLIPDVWAPDFYAEAKQYGDHAGAMKALLDGPRQMWGTLGRLTNKYALREAFLVIFRRGGPLLRFVGPAVHAGMTLRPILIDVAPGDESGSKQGEVISVDIERLMPVPGGE